MKILDEFYPVDFGDFIPIPKDKQPVVAGIFCHSLFIDEKGNCTFDRVNDIQMTSPPMLISSNHKRENNDISTKEKIDKLIDKNSKNDTKNDQNNNTNNEKNNTKNEKKEENEENNGDEKNEGVDMKPECPVCKYMKGGPCKAEFVQWEDCVDSIGETEDMQKCFKVRSF